MQRYYNTDEDKTQKKTETPLDVLIALKAEYDKAEKVRQETDTAYGKAKGNYFDIQGSYCISSDPDEDQRDLQEVFKAEQKMEEAKQVHEEAKRTVEEAYRLCQEAVKVYQEGINTNSVNNKKRKRMSEANTENTTKKRRVELAKDSSPNEIQEPEDRYLKNIQLAKEAFDYCRNKIPIENSATQPLVKDKEKLVDVNKQVEKARARKLEKDEFFLSILMHPYNNYFLEKICKCKNTSKKYKVGNCDELSYLAVNYLRKKNVKRAEVVFIVNGNHFIVVIDREGNLNDISTWGKSCVILDVLNIQIYSPSEIYSKLKCYSFDINKTPPHILPDFTINHQLSVLGEVSYHQNDSENLKRIEQFNKKLDIIAKSCFNYLDEQKFNKLKYIINDSIQYHGLSNLKLERLLGEKIKQIIKLIKQEDNHDKILNEILTNFMLITYGEQTALYTAVYYGYVQIVEGLLKRSASTYLGKQEGFLPLHIAAREGHANIIELLLNYDANKQTVSQPDYTGASPLWLAAQNGNVKAVEMLINAGAKINQPCTGDSTPLFIAALTGHVNIVKILLEKRADYTIPYKTTKEHLLRLYADSSFDIQKNIHRLISQKGAAESLIEITPMEIAWVMGHTEIVKLLTETIINKNSSNISQHNIFTTHNSLNLATYQTQTQKTSPVNYNKTL